MVSICSWSKDWAIIRRYLTVLTRYPLSSFSRMILCPGFIIFLCWYIVSNIEGEYAIKTAETFISYMAAITLFATMFNIYSFANTLVHDKSTGMKSLMISMNLSRFHYYRATTICFLALVLPVALIIGLVSRIYLFDSSVSYATVIGLFILFSFHSEALMTAFVSFVTSTNYTFIILVLLVLENSMHDLGKHVISHSDSWSPVVLFMLSFSPYEALRLFSDEYLAQKRSTDGTITQPYYLILLSQLFWTLVFKLFTYWFEEVCPWQITSGVRHPCFCFGAGKASKRSDPVDVDDSGGNSALSARYFESTNKERVDIGIMVNHVTKSYSNVPAVNDVSFAIYKGETTLLLGHNGAGKSTLMNMILGLTEADNGFVRIVARHQLRTSIGVCPQASVLDDDLTVKEHLELFSDIKSNLSGSERAAHIRQTIEDVSLTGNEKKRPPELSGGMKRKLSLAIAFVGKSEVLILDEPSSGLDPDSRMFVWNAIRRYRSDRTVLLSTQHMEEADYLGDRIAIMSSGRIVCCGSSVFLNKLFGTGYKLRIESRLSKKKHIMDLIRRSYFDAAQLAESGPDLPRDNKVDPIVDIVIELNKSNIKSDADYELDLIRLLEEFENHSESHGIRSYGLKSSSIEDVMLNTGKYFSQEPKETTQLVMTSTGGHIAAITDKNVIRDTTNMNILYALIVKHMQVNYANWFQVLMLRLLLPLWGSYLTIERLGPMGPSNVGARFQSPTLCIMFGHLIYFPVRERASKFKTVQLDSRARAWVYWLSQAIVDLSGSVICALYVSMFAAIYVHEYIRTGSLQYYFLLISVTILYYLAAMSFCYLLSTVLDNPKSSVGYLFVALFMTSVVYVAIMILRLALPVSSKDSQWLQNLFSYLGVLYSPTDAFAFFIMGLVAKCYVGESTCSEQPGPSPVVIGIMALCLQIIFYLTLLVLIENQALDIEWYCNWRNLLALFRRASRRDSIVREVDRDVAEETTKALIAINSPDAEHALVAARLNKSYVLHNKVIEDLAFTVNKGECFGLLGVNGAGKTTTFAMLAAEARPDSGRILANGHYYDESLHYYRQMFGYDPQATPEISLTPYQALYLMARLRGVNEHSIPMMIGSILELLEMSAHTHKPDKKLSGGTKRKLALGMALIGNPAILALDEPTAGVDPLARRGVWQLLRSFRTRNDASIIISSHAMEECEAICDRISIMARGRLRCIGTFLHLRSKFAKGCTLRVQFSAARESAHAAFSNSDSTGQRHAALVDVDSTGAGQHSLSILRSAQVSPVMHSSTSSLRCTDQLVEDLQQHLNSAVGASVFKLADRNVNSVTFNITDNRVRRSILFQMMRDFRQKYPSVNYMINDSSLEEIFISLAREQQEFEQQQRRRGRPQQQHQLVLPQ